MFFSFIEIKKGDKEIFALDSLSLNKTPKEGYKNIALKKIPESIQKEIFQKEKDGTLAINHNAFFDSWSGVVLFIFDREAYNLGNFGKAIKKNNEAWNDPELAKSRRRALIREAIESNISLASEIKGLRQDLKNIYDVLKIPYTENMMRFESMVEKIKKHYPKDDLNQYLPRKEDFEE